MCTKTADLDLAPRFVGSRDNGQLLALEAFGRTVLSEENPSNSTSHRYEPGGTANVTARSKSTCDVAVVRNLLVWLDLEADSLC